MRVAVTGARGFIGSHLVAALTARGDDVVPLSREEVAAAERMAGALRGCAAVVHLAGGGSARAAATWEANVGTTSRVIAAARETGVPRLLLASTVTVTRPRVGAYGASKRRAEQDVLESGLDATVFRFAFVYGPGETGVFAQLVALARALPLLPVVGAGSLDIAPVHVDDVVAAMLAALDRPDVARGKRYTLAGPEASFDDVARGVLQRLGRPARLVHLPISVARVLARLPGIPVTRDNVLGMTQAADHDSSLARAELGFAPRGLEAGLDETFRPA